MYLTRKIQLEPSPELDEMRQVAGDVWDKVVTKFWRTVRKQDHWLGKWDLQRWVCKSDKFSGLCSYSIQAVNDQFFCALKSWRSNKDSNSDLRPPHKQKTFNKVVWKSPAISLQKGKLKLSRGRGYSPFTVKWGDKPKPKQAELIYDQGSYYLCCQYKVEPEDQTTGNKVAGIDLGEIHLAAVDDGEKSFLFNGRELRSKRRYQSKLKSKFQKMLSRKQKGSNSWNRLVESKNQQLKKIQNQVRDILHQMSRKLVDTCLERDVSTLVIGDLKGIRQGLNYGSKVNQKLHQWVHGAFRKMITYKAKLVGMDVELINEAYTSQTCPCCGHRYKPSGRNYDCSKCDFEGHRDVVGAMNIRKKYLGEFGQTNDRMKKSTRVVGEMASPTVGIRFISNAKCSSSSRRKTSFEAATS